MNDTFMSNMIGGFMPHGRCLLWDEWLLGLHVVSDSFIGLAYVAIPLGIHQFMKTRQDLSQNVQRILFLAILFVFFCGMTHLISIWTIWQPSYWMEGGVKFMTGAISLFTAWVLWTAYPEALTIPTFKEKQDLMEMNRQLDELNKKLEASNRDLQQFAYFASHDLQEPLRMVSSFTQLLEKKYKSKLDAEADEYIHYVVDGSKRMKNLIDSLLAYSRESTRDLKMSALDTNRLLESVMKDLKIKVEETGARVHWKSLPKVYGNEAQLVHLFQNLIDNAIKYRREGVPPEIEITCQEQGDRVQFSVRDNGIGIHREAKEKIFELFRRYRPENADTIGYGLGLAICKRILERHGGSIWVESQPGRGSTFFFTIKKAV